MHILRVFNTNVVLARDADGGEVVLTGRGLGFQARPGQEVDPTKVIRVFRPEDGRNADNFGEMLAALAPELVHLVDRVLAPVWAELRREPSSTTVLALADHLSFAIKRVERGMDAVYPLRAEVAHLYPRELHWAENVVAAVNDELELDLPADEAIDRARRLRRGRAYPRSALPAAACSGTRRRPPWRTWRRSCWPGPGPRSARG